MLSAAGADRSGSTLVVALAGNGEQVGIRLAGAPERWITAQAGAPEGPRIDPQQQAVAAPLTGDSGVIDAAGFGAQALLFAPESAHAFESLFAHRPGAGGRRASTRLPIPHSGGMRRRARCRCAWFAKALYRLPPSR